MAGRVLKEFIGHNPARTKPKTAWDYRNRRMGDFLKELHLTNGRAMGVPII